MSKYTEHDRHPVLCIDGIIFNDESKVLLTRRSVDPQKGWWSIIGGRVKVADNNCEAALVREVKEETGLDVEITNLVGVLAQPQRVLPADPRFYVVQMVYTARVIGGVLTKNDEADEFRWVTFDEAMAESLAFNHNDILQFYTEKKEQNKLINPKRRVFSEYFEIGFHYTQNEYRRFTTNAIILNDRNEILLAQRVQSPYIGSWDFPGGHMYMGESIEECLKREVKEELGVEGEIGDLFHVYSDTGHSPKAADVIAFYFFTISNYSFVKNIEMGAFAFFPFAALPQEIAYHNEGALKDIKEYIESHPEKFHS